jgi:putative addiction module component (TIGR02574 family)
MSLDPRERDEVAEALWQCAVPAEFTPEQLAEVHFRIEEIDSGKVEPIPGDLVMQELRNRFAR